MNHKQIIDKWPSKRLLAESVGASVTAVRGWYKRNRIPVVYWPRIVQAGKGLRLGVRILDFVEQRGAARPAK